MFNCFRAFLAGLKWAKLSWEKQVMSPVCVHHCKVERFVGLFTFVVAVNRV